MCLIKNRKDCILQNKVLSYPSIWMKKYIVIVACDYTVGRETGYVLILCQGFGMIPVVTSFPAVTIFYLSGYSETSAFFN